MASKLTLFLVAAAILGSPAAASPLYELQKTIKLGGDGGWDYLTFDPAGGRLFISRATRVQIVDPKSGNILGEIPNTPGVHGIALAPDLGKGFTSNGKASTVTIFDLKTLKEMGVVKLSGQNPDSIVYDPADKLVLTFNGRSKNASVVDPAKNAETGTIPLDGKPESAATDGKGTVFVDIEDQNEIQAIDPRAGAVTATWPLPGCDSPAGLSIDPERRRLFASCHSQTLVVVDADSGQVVASVPIGQGTDASAFDAKAKLVFSSNGDGTLTVINAKSGDDFKVLENATTQRGARTMAVDPASGSVYLVTADFKESPPAEGQTRPRREILPGTFRLLVLQRH